MSALPALDLIDFDSLLTEEERLVRRTARQFVDDRVLPVITRHFREATFPTELIAEMGELGFLRRQPARLRLRRHERHRVRADHAGTRARRQRATQLRLGTEQPLDVRHLRLRKRWPETALAAANAARQGAGLLRAHRAGLRLQSVGDADQRPSATANSYVLNGEKTWITNGSLAEVAIVWAREGEADPRLSGRKRHAGLYRPPTCTTNGRCGPRSRRVCRWSTAAFQRKMRFPSALSLKAALGCLTQARYGIGWGAIGAALACLGTVRDYTVLRKQFDNRPIASHQLVQGELAWMITEISKAQLLAHHVGRLKAQGRLHHSQISMLKRNNAWMALEVARRGPRSARGQRHHRRVPGLPAHG